MRYHNIYWDLTRSIEISQWSTEGFEKDLNSKQISILFNSNTDLSTDGTENGTDDTEDISRTGSYNIGIILLHYHWWILWLSEQSEFGQSVGQSVTIWI